MKGKVVFIPIRHGVEVEVNDLGIFGVSGTNKYLGFKPRGGAKREGWLVVLQSDGPSAIRRKTAARGPNDR